MMRKSDSEMLKVLYNQLVELKELVTGAQAEEKPAAKKAEAKTETKVEAPKEESKGKAKDITLDNIKDDKGAKK